MYWYQKWFLKKKKHYKHVFSRKNTLENNYYYILKAAENIHLRVLCLKRVPRFGFLKHNRGGLLHVIPEWYDELTHHTNLCPRKVVIWTTSWKSIVANAWPKKLAWESNASLPSNSKRQNLRDGCSSMIRNIPKSV